MLKTYLPLTLAAVLALSGCTGATTVGTPPGVTKAAAGTDNSAWRDIEATEPQIRRDARPAESCADIPHPKPLTCPDA